MSEAQRSASFMSPGLSVKLPLRKENDALDERDDRSDRADTGRLPWKDDRADGGRKLIFYGVCSRLRVAVRRSSDPLVWATLSAEVVSLWYGTNGCLAGGRTS